MPLSGKIGYHKVPTNLPPQLVPLVINQDDFFPAGILKKDLNNWGPRVGLAYNVNDKMVAAHRIRRLLRQPESQRAAVLAPGAAVLRAVLAPADGDGSQLQCGHAVPGSEQHPAVPRAVLDGSEQPQRLHRAVERQRAALAAAATISSRSPTPAAAATTSTSASTSTRRSPARRRSRRACRTRRSSRRFSIRRMPAGRGSMASRSASRSATRPACSSSATTSSRRAPTTGRARSRRTTPRLPGTWMPTRDRHATTSGIARAISGGYELPFGPGKRWLSDGGVAAYVLGGWQVQGIIRAGIGLPVPVTSTNVCQCGSFVPQRVNFAPGREEDAGNIDNPTPRTAGSIRPRISCRRPARRAPPAATPCAARVPARRLLAHQAVPDRQGARRVPVGGLQPLQPRELRHARSEHLESRPSARSRRPTTDATCSSGCGSSGSAHSRCLRPNHSRMP